MAIRIITDTSADLPLSMQEEWDIKIVPFSVFFEDKEYVSMYELSNEDFYGLLDQSEKLPTTAQITPTQYEDIFRPYVEAGDTVIMMPISKELSGTYNSACIAAREFPEGSVHVVDTVQVTFGLGILVEIAVKLRNDGLSAEEIVEKLNHYKTKIRIYAVIGDLKYLKLGGRLSTATAIVGTVLGIKPIINVVDGKVNNFDRVRGYRAGYDKLLGYIENDGVDDAFSFCFAHANSLGELEKFIDYSAETLGGLKTKITSIGSIVGTHVGPNVVGVGFVAK